MKKLSVYATVISKIPEINGNRKKLCSFTNENDATMYHDFKSKYESSRDEKIVIVYEGECEQIENVFEVFERQPYEDDRTISVHKSLECAIDVIEKYNYHNKGFQKPYLSIKIHQLQP